MTRLIRDVKQDVAHEVKEPCGAWYCIHTHTTLWKIMWQAHSVWTRGLVSDEHMGAICWVNDALV